MTSTSAAGFATLDVAAVLFDLDGTLIDSAPDLGGAGNDLRTRRGLPELSNRSAYGSVALGWAARRSRMTDAAYRPP